MVGIEDWPRDWLERAVEGGGRNAAAARRILAERDGVFDDSTGGMPLAKPGERANPTADKRVKLIIPD